MKPEHELHYTEKRGIAYRDCAEPRNKGLAKLSQLDLYEVEESRARKKPVVVYVHGGGWIAGDKSEIRENVALLKFFLRNGYLVAAVNFRLLRNWISPDTTYRDQANDIAAALKWLNSNVEQFGGLPADFVLVGFSSGAHLSALVALDENYLSRQDLPPDLIRAVIALDVHAYDVSAAVDFMKDTPLQENIPLMKFLFGERRAQQALASPTTYVRNPQKRYFLILSSGAKGSLSQTVSKDLSELFRDRLAKNGHWAVHEHLKDRSHASILSKFGTRDDRVSEKLQIFLDILEAFRERGSEERESQYPPSRESNRRSALMLDAVLRADSPRRSIGDVASEVGVRIPDIYAWRNQFELHREMNAAAEKGRFRSQEFTSEASGKSDRRFSDELKREALQRLESSAQPAIQIARELRIPVNVLYQWKKHSEHRRKSNS